MTGWLILGFCLTVTVSVSLVNMFYKEQTKQYETCKKENCILKEKLDIAQSQSEDGKEKLRRLREFTQIQAREIKRLREGR